MLNNVRKLEICKNKNIKQKKPKNFAIDITLSLNSWEEIDLQEQKRKWGKNVYKFMVRLMGFSLTLSKSPYKYLKPNPTFQRPMNIFWLKITLLIKIFNLEFEDMINDFVSFIFIVFQIFYFNKYSHKDYYHHGDTVFSY